MFLNHVSLTTGRSSYSSSKDFDFKDLQKTAAWLNAIMNSDKYHTLPFKSPVFGGWRAAAYNIDGCLLMIICTYADDNCTASACDEIGTPVLSFGITRSTGGESLWKLMNEKFADEGSMREGGMPSAPWMAVVNYTASISFPMFSEGLASIEEVFGWAWLFYVSYSDACKTGSFPAYQAPVVEKQPECFSMVS